MRQRQRAQGQRCPERVRRVAIAQPAVGEGEKGQREDQAEQGGVMRIQVGGDEAQPQQQRGGHGPAQPLIAQLRAKIIGQPERENAQRRAHAQLRLVHAGAQLRAQVGDDGRKTGRIEVGDIRMPGRQRMEIAALAQHQRQIAKALRVRIQRRRQQQGGDGEDQRRQRQERQVARAGPALVAVGQLPPLPLRA